MARPLSHTRRSGLHRHKTPPTISGGSLRAGAAVALDRQQINAWLADDTLFNVWTIDQSGWVDPFTGAVIKTRQGSLKAAKRHLLKNRPWMKFGLRTMPELQAIRWGHHLQRLIEADGRLRIFRKDGTWLNPYDGKWVGGIPLENGKVSFATVQGMAAAVAKSPEAQRRAEMLDAAEIARIVHGPSTGSGRLTAMPAGPPSQTRTPGTPTLEAPEERNTDLHRAKAVLEKMLPQIPQIPGWEIGVCWEPHSVIGGDFYDLIRVDPRHLFMAIGDVSGHGTSAALVVASTLKSLRHAVKGGGNLSDIIVAFNDDIQEDLLKSYFITMFAALIDLETRVMTCVCTGHHPAFVANPKRRVILSQLGNAAPAIGLMKGEMLLPHLEPMTVELKPGDTVLQYTDGLNEATNADKQEYGRRRVMAAFLLALDDPAELGVKRMVGGARKFSNERFNDDVTALSIKVLEREKGS